MSLIVDASVAAKWLVSEPDSDRAQALLMDWRAARLDLLAPEIILAEIGNMLCKRVLRDRMPTAAAVELYGKFNLLHLPIVPINQFVPQALELAVQNASSVYDCLYLALALNTGSTLLTADEKLYRALRGNFVQVRLLRDWA